MRRVLHSRTILVILVVLGLGIFAGLIILSGPKLVLTELLAVGWLGFLAVLVNVVGSFLAWCASWFLLLRGAGIAVSFGAIAPPMLAGAAVSYITPVSYLGGEPVRVYWVAKDKGVPMPQVVATVVVERLFSGVSLLAFALLGAFFALVSPVLPSAERGGVALVLGVMILFFSLGMASFARNYRWLSRLLGFLGRRLPRWKFLARAAERTAEMEEHIYIVLSQRPLHTWPSLLFQLLSVFLNYIRPQIFLYFTHQTLFTFPQLSLFFTLSLLVGAFLWMTPGGLGLADGGRAGIFQLLGVPLSSAIAYNVLFRFVELLQVGVGLHLLVRHGLVKLGGERITTPMDDPRSRQ